MLTNLFFKTRRVCICDFYSAKTCSAAHATPRLENRATGFGKQISNQHYLMAVIRVLFPRQEVICSKVTIFSPLHRTPLSTHTQCEHTQLGLVRTVVLCQSCTLEILGEIKKKLTTQNTHVQVPPTQLIQNLWVL